MRISFTRVLSAVDLNVPACSLVVVLLMIAGCSGQEKGVLPMEKFPIKHVSVQGINMSYLEKGAGDPLVLVHGIPTSSFLWREMIDGLSSHGKVIALDLPGFGFSDPPRDGDYTISNYAAMLEYFFEALSLEPATLVCHDLGGPIALTYALRHPDKYDRLIILDTFLHNALPPWPLSMRIAKIRPLGEIAMWLGGRSIARSGLEMGVRDKSLISDEIVRRYYMPEGSPGKLNASMLGVLRIDYMEDLRFIENNLGTIEKPALVLWGEADKYLPLSLGKRIHHDITGSKMVTIPNCGHFVQEEQPDLATRIMVSFLEQVS